MQGMSCVGLTVLVLVLLRHLTWAVQLEVPPTVRVNTAALIAYVRRDDDPPRWALNMSEAGGANPQTLSTVNVDLRRGVFELVIPREGALQLTAVNPIDLSEAYSIPAPFTSTSPAAEDPDIDNTGNETSTTDQPSEPSSTSVDPASSPGSPPSDASTKSSKLPAIIGGAIAGAFLLFLLVGLIVFFRCRRKKRPTTFYRERMVKAQDSEPSFRTSSSSQQTLNMTGGPDLTHVSISSAPSVYVDKGKGKAIELEEEPHEIEAGRSGN